MSDYLADFRKLMTGSGIGESPASQRLTVLSSRRSTSRANALADKPERSIAFRRRSAGVMRHFISLLDPVGQRKQLAALRDEAVVVRLAGAAPAHRLVGVELGVVLKGEGDFADFLGSHVHNLAPRMPGGIALTQGNIGRIPYRAIALMQSLQSVSEDTQ
jgi:hypothetical protein